MAAPRKLAVILGVGPGLSTSIASLLSPTHSLVLLSRSLPGSLPSLSLPSSIPSSNILALSADGSASSLQRAFAEVDAKWPDARVDVGIYNVNEKFELKGFLDRTEKNLRSGLESGVVGGFNFAQAIIPRFLSNPAPSSLSPDDPAARLARGTLIFTGATMALKAGAQFSSLSPGMFARRSLAQSLAREFGPQGVHVAHVVIDGIMDTPGVAKWAGEDKEGKRMVTDEVAHTYVDLVNQKRSAWTHELDLRPDVEAW
ncbi:hypothetical protein IAT38_005372 [Cryptococcus sp. DSM 104549]